VTTRYPQTILVACPVPWDESEEVIEPLFRESIRRVLADGYRDVYVFGTGGEGYAVDTRRFRQVLGIFREETTADDIRPMVGVIGMSSQAIIERIGYAHEVGFRTFQISFPAWGALLDDEVDRFFADVCGRFPDSSFLHYNLPRTKRLIGGRDYARILRSVPNLVATKATDGGVAGARDLLVHAPELQHFLSEFDLPHGTMFGECSLLASFAQLAPIRIRELFDACRLRDEPAMLRLQHEFYAMNAGLWEQTVAGPHMDGAYDKMLVKLGLLSDYPLRLLSPYRGFPDDDFRACRTYLYERYPEWLRPGIKGS